MKKMGLVEKILKHFGYVKKSVNKKRRPKLKVCKVCGDERIEALGLCINCYQRQHRKKLARKNKTCPKRLEFMRIKKVHNLSNPILADYMGVSSTQISRYTRGEATISQDQLDKLKQKASNNGRALKMTRLEKRREMFC